MGQYVEIPEFRRTIRVIGIVISTIGSTVLIGWLLSIPTLTSVYTKFHPMAQNTAVLFTILGAILITAGRRRVSRFVRMELVVATALISTYGLLVFVETVAGTSLTLTQAVLAPREFTGIKNANYMSPLSGIFFFVTGLSLVPFLVRRAPRILRTIAGWTGAGVSLGAFLVTYGYLLNEPFMYGEFCDPMALLTSISFNLAGVSLMLFGGSTSILGIFMGENTRSRTLRLFLPLVVITCFVQEVMHHWYNSTDLDRFLVLALVPTGAAIIGAVASGKLAQFLSHQLASSARQAADSHSMFQSAIENSHDLYWTLDTSGRFIYANRRSSEVAGHAVEDWIGKDFAPLVHPDDLSNVMSRFLGALQGEPQEYELRVLGGSGQVVFLEVTTLPEYESGKIVRIASYGKDITERRVSDEALRRTAETLRESQRIARLGSYDLDIVTGRWTNSEELDGIFGIDQSFDRTPEGWLKLIHPDWREQMQQHLFHDVLSKRQSFNKEYKIIRRADGVERWVHGLGKLEYDDLGTPVRMIGTIQDITERKNLELERESLSVQLRQAQKLETIGTLAGGVAHDFNNILTPIMIYSEMAALGLEETHPSRNDIEQVIAGAHRAKDLVKQILTFSRQGENERVTMDIVPIAKEVSKLLGASLPATISIDINVDTGGAMVLADPSQIHQVLMNLCTNAYHAMRDRGGKLKIELTAVTLHEELKASSCTLPDGSYICLSVSDTGCGMDERTRERVFEPFFTTKPVGEGTGLGLSVVHGIVKNHDGAISVTSVPNEGTRFSVYLPQVREESTSDIATTDSLRHGNERILAVDDESSVVNALHDVLEKALGYSVTVFTDSCEVIEHLNDSAHLYDLVIVDHTMPGKSGVDVAAHVKRLRPELPVVLLTGYSQNSDTSGEAKGLFDQVVMKPLRASEIGNVVRQTLDARKATA